MEMIAVVVLMIRREKRFCKNFLTYSEISVSLRRILEIIIHELSWADFHSLGAHTRRSPADSGLLLRISRAGHLGNHFGEQRSHRAAHLGHL